MVIIIVAALALAWGITTFIACPYTIPSGSMEDTLQINDKVISEEISYHFNDPKVGDIVTFNPPSDPERTYIKRVIAVGGQTVTLKDGYVYVDGVQLNEPYTGGKPSLPLDGSTITFPYTVPEGYIWVMGDNRTNSSDSRAFGAVPLSAVNGHAVWRYWPVARFGALE